MTAAVAVQPGQVWESRDKRAGRTGRRVVVVKAPQSWEAPAAGERAVVRPVGPGRRQSTVLITPTGLAGYRHIVETPAETAARHFADDTRHHVVTVLKDDGLYRHVRCARPGTGNQRFDLITWPGHLAVSGDMGDLVFTRVPDMFEFFRVPEGRSIDFAHWAQKLTVGRDEVKEYSPALFRSHVEDYLTDWVTDLEDEIRGWTDYDGVIDQCMNQGVVQELKDAVRYEVLAYADDGEHEARSALERFRHPGHLLNAGTPGFFNVTDAGEDYEFTDAWEWDFTDWTPRFLWLCHGIAWGVRQYFEAGGKVAYSERQWMDAQRSAGVAARARRARTPRRPASARGQVAVTHAGIPAVENVRVAGGVL